MRHFLNWWQSQTSTTKNVLTLLLAVASASIFLEALFSGSVAGIGLNFGTEIIGALLTYALIDRLIRGREEKENLKASLIRQLSSHIHSEAIRAAEELSFHRWLYDGSLANADLEAARLAGAHLTHANLSNAVLRLADLQDAHLLGADLQGAFMQGANLASALLWDANLEGAKLKGANLKGTNLNGANLKDAALSDDSFDENTTLPDDTHWSQGTDLSRFTNPKHPNFWHPRKPYWRAHMENSPKK